MAGHTYDSRFNEGAGVEQDMEWLVVGGRRGAGKEIRSHHPSRLIPPTFSCHHGALPIQPLAEMTFRSSFSYMWQAMSRTFTLFIHSIPNIHSWPDMSFFSHKHFISVLSKACPGCIYHALYTILYLHIHISICT